MNGSPRRVRLALIDDHRLVAEALRLRLATEPDLELVGAAHRIEEGVGLLREMRPDVVLLDQLLPDGNGVDAAGELRAILPEVRILVLTSVVDDRLVASAMQHGCAGVITKDRPLDELLHAIRAVARGQSVFPADAFTTAGGRGRSGLGSDLTPRELEVLQLLADGVSNDEIADRLGLTINTVRNYIQAVLGKLQAHSKLEAVAIAARHGLVEVGRPQRG